jgi:hypothetical protein
MQKTENIQNHEVSNGRATAQGDAIHRKYERLKLGRSQAYSRSCDLCSQWLRKLVCCTWLQLQTTPWTCRESCTAVHSVCTVPYGGARVAFTLSDSQPLFLSKRRPCTSLAARSQAVLLMIWGSHSGGNVVYRRFGESSPPYSRLKIKLSKKPAWSREKRKLVPCLVWPLTLKMEANFPSETSFDFQLLQDVIGAGTMQLVKRLTMGWTTE